LTHDLLHADFSVDAKPFVTRDFGAYTATVINGTYQIQARTTPSRPASSYTWFARTAYNVDVSADVIAVHENGGSAFVGVACLDEPNQNGHGYAFVVDASGHGLEKTNMPNGTSLAGGDGAPLVASSRSAPASHLQSGRADVERGERPGLHQRC
jgi:hypothetical protein